MSDAKSRILFVENGVHAGATVSFDNPGEVFLGSSPEADICITDSGIEHQHVSIVLDAEGKMSLQAMQAGVSLFESPLQTGKRVPLCVGSRFAIVGIVFHIGDTDNFQRVRLDDATSQDSFVVNVEQEELAQLMYWRKHAPTKYLAALFKGKIYTYRQYIVGLFMLGIMVGGSMKLMVLDQTALRQDMLDQIAVRFPEVEAQLDSYTGATVYTGYVDSYAELEELRSVAWLADTGLSVMRVHVMSAIKANIDTFLHSFYLVKEINAIGPGRFRVKVYGEDSVKSIAAWDYRHLEEQVQRLVPGLQFVRIELDRSVERHVVSAPLSSLGMSLIMSSGRLSYLVTAEGQPLFSGARLQDGRLDRITAEGVEIMSRHDATIFDMRY